MPFECPEDLLGRLLYFKTVNGMSFELLGTAMGRDPEQLIDWRCNGVKPCKVYRQIPEGHVQNF